jgi:small subunit ribosomal protein S9
MSINGRDAEEYFGRPGVTKLIETPLVVTDNVGRYDAMIHVRGGGITGQAGACRHGLSRALLALDPDNRQALRSNGFLTRDARMVERKKYGQRGARRKFQFSKR